MTITEFLLARIAEDEAEARALRSEWEDSPPSVYDFAQVGGLDAGDPDRVLAECEAKRRIVELHDNRYGMGECKSCADGWHDQTYGENGYDPLPYPCPTLRYVATIYADHPDYRDEWRP